MSTKEFPLHAILTVSTGRLWGPFAEAHELMEHLAGHPLWTHELPSAAPYLRAEILRQHPSVTPTAAEMGRLDAATGRERGEAFQYAAAATQAVADRLGFAAARVQAGSKTRTQNPLETAAAVLGVPK